MSSTSRRLGFPSFLLRLFSNAVPPVALLESVVFLNYLSVFSTFPVGLRTLSPVSSYAWAEEPFVFGVWSQVSGVCVFPCCVASAVVYGGVISPLCCP